MTPTLQRVHTSGESILIIGGDSTADLLVGARVTVGGMVQRYTLLANATYDSVNDQTTVAITPPLLHTFSAGMPVTITTDTDLTISQASGNSATIVVGPQGQVPTPGQFMNLGTGSDLQVTGVSVVDAAAGTYTVSFDTDVSGITTGAGAEALTVSETRLMTDALSFSFGTNPTPALRLDDDGLIVGNDKFTVDASGNVAVTGNVASAGNLIARNIILVGNDGDIAGGGSSTPTNFVTAATTLNDPDGASSTLTLTFSDNSQHIFTSAAPRPISKQKFVVTGQFRNLFNNDAPLQTYFMKWSGATENPQVLGKLTLPFDCTLKKVSYAWQSSDETAFELPQFSPGGDEPAFALRLALVDPNDDNEPSLIIHSQPVETIKVMTTANSGGFPHGVVTTDTSLNEGQTIGVLGVLENCVAEDMDEGADLLLVFVFEIEPESTEEPR